jgi:hypothetical protein
LRTFNLRDPNTVVEIDNPVNYKVLPQDSVALHHVLYHLTPQMTTWHHQFSQLVSQGVTANRVFIDGSFDPVIYTESQLNELIELAQQFWPNSKILLLSSDVKHFGIGNENICWFPWCFLNIYQESRPRVRQKRIGCLNRRNAPHRVWLMHHLLTQGLLDAERDVYSISFLSHYDQVSASNVAAWLNQPPWFNDLIYHHQPADVATHPDDFANDYTTNHPAWSTAIAIITETEPGPWTMITEKTLKAIMSRSCWTSYMGDDGYQLMEVLGFEPRLFDSHAEGYNIVPTLDLCRKLDTESVAMDYYHSRVQQIEHNFEWFGGADGSTNQLGPWWENYYPQLRYKLG